MKEKKLKKIKIYEYKNIREQNVDFESKDVVFYGLNGAGKSNLCKWLVNYCYGKDADDSIHAAVGKIDHKRNVIWSSSYRTQKIPLNKPYLLKCEDFKFESTDKYKYNVFDENIEINLRELYFYCLEEKIQDKVLNIFNKIYSNVLESINGIEDLEYLSDGHRSVLMIILNIFYNLDINNWKVEETICIIDELELNVHLSIQRNLYLILKDEFLGMQFIFSTHSPVVLSTLEKEKVKVYTLINGILEESNFNYYVHDIEEILEDSFEIKIYNDEVEKNLQKIRIKYNEYVNNRISKEHFCEFLNFIPEKIRENEYILDYYTILNEGD